MDNLIGKRLDGLYEVQELIGSGGMANVYKATDLLENRLVAVKILREEYGFLGYIHVKAIPGASPEAIRRSSGFWRTPAVRARTS